MGEEAHQGRDAATLEVVTVVVGLLTHGKVEGLEAPAVQVGGLSLEDGLIQLPVAELF